MKYNENLNNLETLASKLDFDSEFFENDGIMEFRETGDIFKIIFNEGGYIDFSKDFFIKLLNELVNVKDIPLCCYNTDDVKLFILIDELEEIEVFERSGSYIYSINKDGFICESSFHELIENFLCEVNERSIQQIIKNIGE